ncbi:MAG TPA: TetR/AcrR family transcriptional regulator [Steroidobacteraceae bacterium]|nr:TetR/AcrR family transcriptional regulator [Steroidobacteraceae bacterium]
MAPTPAHRPAARGRPKDGRIDRDVVRVVLDLLDSRGYRHVTIERVARSARCARASLYRRWQSKRHLVAYAVVSTLGAQPAPDTGSLRGDLICAVDTLRHAFAGPLGRALPGLAADMAQDPRLARTIRTEVLTRRRRSIRGALVRGMRRGEIRRRKDVAPLIDLLTAPCYFRALFGHARVTRAFIESVVDYTLRAAG